MSQPSDSRPTIAAILTLGIVAALAGCNGSARREVYQQKMAGEIRILEDQLYEADYHNRVLNDQLERCRVQAETGRGVTPAPTSPGLLNHSAISPKSSVDAPIPDPIPNADRSENDQNEIDMEEGFDEEGFDSEDLELPPVEEGQVITPDSINESEPAIEPIPLSDPEPIELPAPGLPEPPGANDLEIPQIDPGRIIPPPAGGEEDADRPGKIELPPSASSDSGIPEKLKVHAGLTSGVETDGEQNEMSVVIHVVDKLGQTVDLERFDIDAELSVVLLDPERESSLSRIGRWDFSTDQIASLIQRDPISAIRVPIKWTGDRPIGKQIAVHVRLRAEEDDMRCERRVMIDKKKVIAEWTPRGEDVRR